MNKKGFTLTEILGVVVILGLLMLVITPAVLNRVSSHEEEVSGVQKEMLKEAVGLYLKDHNLSSGCISIETLKNNGYLNDDYKGVTSAVKNITAVDQNGNSCNP